MTSDTAKPFFYRTRQHRMAFAARAEDMSLAAAASGRLVRSIFAVQRWWGWWSATVPRVRIGFSGLVVQAADSHCRLGFLRRRSVDGSAQRDAVCCLTEPVSPEASVRVRVRGVIDEGDRITYTQAIAITGRSHRYPEVGNGRHHDAGGRRSREDVVGPHQPVPDGCAMCRHPA